MCAVPDLCCQIAVCQQDPATINRTEAVQKPCSVFSSRIPLQDHASKMANIRPLEIIWSITTDMVKSKEPKNKSQMKNIISMVCRDINYGNDLCKRLMQSIPARLEVLIVKAGRQYYQIKREEYLADCISMSEPYKSHQ